MEGDNLVVQSFMFGRRRVKLFAKSIDRDCVMCLPFGATVKFANLPAMILARVGTVLVATLMDLSNWDGYSVRDDELRFVNGAVVKLSELPEYTGLRYISAAEFFQAAEAASPRTSTEVFDKDHSAPASAATPTVHAAV